MAPAGADGEAGVVGPGWPPPGAGAVVEGVLRGWGGAVALIGVVRVWWPEAEGVRWG
ncbi:hypothetical protein ACFU3E_26915 [Streptomyces sp. NPDC057424]|uniref:hypothetical protein n=1 Tax=Streptomyces sp. NPDC057424 TaxID=3346127 RepID=UPI003686A64B